jgi:hypothetical protein
MDHNRGRGQTFVIMGPEKMWKFDNASHYNVYDFEPVTKVIKIFSCITK